MRINQIKETCLYVRDLDITREFYEEKLGLELISLVEGRHVFFRAGTSVLLCFIAAETKVDTKLPPHFGEGNLHLAFECPSSDYETWQSRVGEQGIEILHESTWRDGLRSFYFRDPDGHLLEFVEPGIWGA